MCDPRVETCNTETQVTYNGVPLRDFSAVRTASYIPQTDVHIGELTVRETFDFAARCQGSGFKPGAARSPFLRVWLLQLLGFSLQVHWL